MICHRSVSYRFSKPGEEAALEKKGIAFEAPNEREEHSYYQL